MYCMFGNPPNSTNLLKVKGIVSKRAQFEIFHRPHPFINNIWPAFAKLLDTRPITIHKFYSTGLDCLNKTFVLFKMYNVVS